MRFWFRQFGVLGLTVLDRKNILGNAGPQKSDAWLPLSGGQEYGELLDEHFAALDAHFFG